MSPTLQEFSLPTQISAGSSFPIRSVVVRFDAVDELADASADLRQTKSDAWRVAMAATSDPEVALRVGYLIDQADSVPKVMFALAIIGALAAAAESADTPIDVDAWVASLEAKFADHPEGGCVTRACCLQRFFVRTQADADEAERRALWDADFVLELVEASIRNMFDRAPQPNTHFLRDADMPEWDRAAWWRADLEALRDARDEARARVEVTLSTCSKCDGRIMANHHEWWCPICSNVNSPGDI